MGMDFYFAARWKEFSGVILQVHSPDRVYSLKCAQTVNMP
jgi:hypothetical protein